MGVKKIWPYASTHRTRQATCIIILPFSLCKGTYNSRIDEILYVNLIL